MLNNYLIYGLVFRGATPRWESAKLQDMRRIEPTLLHKINQRTIVETLLQRGPSSRAEVVRYSGISAPTVSKAVALLMELGLLEEGDSSPGVFGRPGKLLRLARRTLR